MSTYDTVDRRREPADGGWSLLAATHLAEGRLQVAALREAGQSADPDVVRASLEQLSEVIAQAHAYALAAAATPAGLAEDACRRLGTLVTDQVVSTADLLAAASDAERQGHDLILCALAALDHDDPGHRHLQSARDLIRSLRALTTSQTVVPRDRLRFPVLRAIAELRSAAASFERSTGHP